MKKFTIGQSLVVNNTIKRHQLNTVCQSAKCPNIFECFSKGTATFMILGDTCTRHCRFCAVKKNKSIGWTQEPDEVIRVADACREIKLKHVVITSVTRDDLADGGASVFHDTIHEIRKAVPDISIEVLTPDFLGNKQSIEKVISAKPDIFNHNIETIWQLYPEIRPEADYLRSLQLLAFVKKLDSKITTKSGLMLGLGEKQEETLEALRHLRKANCDIVTIGQYLKPENSGQTIEVKRFVTPDEFSFYRIAGNEIGFKKVISGPFVRSSYEANEVFSDVQAETKLRVSQAGLQF